MNGAVRVPAAEERASRLSGHPAGLVRGVLADRVVVSTQLDPFLTLKAAKDYTGLSVKTLRRAVNDHPDRALPAYRVGRGDTVILLRRSEIDGWLAARRTVGRPSLVAALRALGPRASA
jgi:excisionase family DNA binding protein